MNCCEQGKGKGKPTADCQLATAKLCAVLLKIYRRQSWERAPRNLPLKTNNKVLLNFAASRPVSPSPLELPLPLPSQELPQSCLGKIMARHKAMSSSSSSTTLCGFVLGVAGNHPQCVRLQVDVAAPPAFPTWKWFLLKRRRHSRPGRQAGSPALFTFGHQQ